MIGESKPNFALDLSNDGIALWYRSSGGNWDSLGSVSLSAPDFKEQVIALRDSAGGGSSAKARRTVVRIPRSEVMLDKVRLGVFEGEAAERHAQKQITELTPYPLDEIAFDLGEKGVGNMAPVGIVARQTLIEAEEFAKVNGFEPIYFTTQYSSKEFPREPRFYLASEPSAAKRLWFVPWVAAASVGLAIGYFGYSYLSTPKEQQPVPVAQIEEPLQELPAAEPETILAAVEPVNQPEETENTIPAVQLGLQDIAPSLPPVLVTLNAPEITSYPELLTGSVKRSAQVNDPLVVRLKAEKRKSPLVSISSKEIKTSSLQIEEARRDLPEVNVNDEIVGIIQSDLAVLTLDTPSLNQPIQLAALTKPDQPNAPIEINRLPANKEVSNGVSKLARTTADRPPPPPSLVTAEPGTLTPTPEGTLGPDNILIYSGTPPRKPPVRPGTVLLEPDPLTGFRPRLRPDGLVPQDQLSESVDPVEEPTILAFADPALRPFRPRIRPEGLAPQIPDQDQIAAAIAADALTQIGSASLLDQADPALKPFKPKLRPDGFAPQTDPANLIADAIENDTAEQAETSILALADPTLRQFRPRNRPTNLTTPSDLIANAIQDDTVVQAIELDTKQQGANSLLALADPALKNKKTRARPSNLRIVPSREKLGLLALADPALAGKRAKSRPRNLRVLRKAEPEPETEAPVEAPDEVKPKNTISTATKLAIARSPKPKKRPAKLARVAKRVLSNDVDLGSGGSTKTSAKTPRSAVGTAKPAPGPTTSTVARAATEKSKFRKSKMSLVGVFGTPSARRALVRLPSGRYVKVQKGDRLRGWKISAIGESSLRIKKGNRDQVLRMP